MLLSLPFPELNLAGLAGVHSVTVGIYIPGQQETTG